jgi:RNA polymerase sigma factor (TIGR02999 family)
MCYDASIFEIPMAIGEPSAPAPGEVTVLLKKVVGGELSARNRLVDLLYPELKRLAEQRMRSERADHTLQPSALVNEFFLEIVRVKGINWRDRAHFLAVASQAMKRFLIDYARAHNAGRRGGGKTAVELQEFGVKSKIIDAVVLGDLLDRMALEEPRMATVLELRCFGGLTHAEIGLALGIDERTSKRDWQVAQAWLRAQLMKPPSNHDT